MIFNSFEFLVFYPIVLALFFLLPSKWRWIMLLVASYYFYLSWNASLIFLIVFTTVVSWVSSLLIERGHDRHPDKPNGPLEKLWLILTLVASLGVLFFFKYFNFLSKSVNDVINLIAPTPSDPLILNLILPVGISFYTFQTLSYVIDVYRGSVKTEKHFGYYALYVSFFPQLVAGPIERPENLIPQLHADHKPEWNNTVRGLRKMLIGFFKKIAVADLISPMVNAVYNDAENATGIGVLIATVLFAFQIYCDFAGYTDIAIGCSEIMGIKLMQNFDRPYISETIAEFWRRWHISHSSWFKDYIYFPLGGSRCSTFRHMLNICIVFLVSGLWHGAAWTFVMWGLLHGIYQVIGYFTMPLRNKLWEKLKISTSSVLVKTIRKFNTFLLVCIGWMFFRANSFGDLITLFKKLFTDWHFNGEYFSGTFETMGITVLSAVTAILALLVMQRLDASKLGIIDPSAPPKFDKKGRPLPAEGAAWLSESRYVFILWAIVLAWLILLVGDGASSFIYFQF
ncbi:MAG: MBOAT family protein [Clostridia bacterium]|nr:MBOAT family protein [Clostridia bacterium]